LIPATVYVHFPYCLEKCPYCDFVSYKVERPSIDHAGYANAVLREAKARVESSPRVQRQNISSVFFGGGTPSLWEPNELGRVLSGLKELLRCADDLEVTVECNPTSLDGDRAAALASVGVNRLSVGTQSLRQDALTYLGREHDPAGALAALRDAQARGPARLSTDLIFGLPGQTPEDARDQALALADQGLTHLSCYQLTIEPGTRFGELSRRGRLPLADDGAVAQAFLAIDEGLESRGLRHYEISNYAVPGQEARHNLSYWRGHEYLGLGCGAYGFVRNDGASAGGVRHRNAIDPADYMRRALGGESTTMSSEDLSPTELLRERIMLGLRLHSGLDLAATGQDLGLDPFTPERTRTIERLVAQGRLARSGPTLSIPKASWLFADDIAARLF
jgi:putative oxygen-independent coproporphyrinogen III oxidase